MKQRSGKSKALIWDIAARDYFKRSIEWIKKDSIQNAQYLKEDILTSIRKIPGNPLQHPKDKYRTDNDGSYRAYELYKFRISYFIGSDHIRIVRIRHTKQEPQDY